MSEENGKVCCSCRHNIRTGEITNIECHCDIDNHYIGYIACMEHWCRHWSKEKATYGYCMYHEIECDYKGGCTNCPHNSKEDTEWFMQDEQIAESEGK